MIFLEPLIERTILNGNTFNELEIDNNFRVIVTAVKAAYR